MPLSKLDGTFIAYFNFMVNNRNLDIILFVDINDIGNIKTKAKWHIDSAPFHIESYEEDLLRIIAISLQLILVYLEDIVAFDPLFRSEHIIRQSIYILDAFDKFPWAFVLVQFQDLDTFGASQYVRKYKCLVNRHTFQFNILSTL